MRVVVCLKQILDPEIPPSVFEIDLELKRAKIGNHALVINPFDENALEMALQLKEKNDKVHVIALTYGSERAEEALRKALGVLADEAVHVLKDNNCEEDSYATAKILAVAIKKIGPVDLVMCGRQAGDWDAGQVGSLLAEELGFPSCCFISKIDIKGDKLIFYRQVEGGTEVLESSMPALITVTNDESNVLRIGKVRDVMKAHRKPINKITLDELGIEKSIIEQPQAFTELKSLYIPVYDNVCEIIEGEEPEEKVENLIKKLKSQKVL